MVVNDLLLKCNWRYGLHFFCVRKFEENPIQRTKFHIDTKTPYDRKKPCKIKDVFLHDQTIPTFSSVIICQVWKKKRSCSMTRSKTWAFVWCITLQLFYHTFLRLCRYKVETGPTNDVRFIASICLKCVKLTMTPLLVLRDFCILIYLPLAKRTQIVHRCRNKYKFYKGLDSLHQCFTQSSSP